MGSGQLPLLLVFLDGRPGGLLALAGIPRNPIPEMGRALVVVQVDRVSPDIADEISGTPADMEDECL